MLSRLRRSLTRRRDESGFSLIELVISIAILGAVMSAITAAMVVAMRTNTETDTRLTESRDVQFASTWFSDDIQSANTIQGSATPPCGPDPSANVVLKLTNTDISAIPPGPPDATPPTLWVRYVLRTAPDGATRELHRLACTGGSPDDQIVAYSLSATDDPVLTCIPTCSTATSVSLGLTEKSGLTYTLHGSRRSS